MIEHTGFLRVDGEMFRVDKKVRDEEMECVGGY